MNATRGWNELRNILCIRPDNLGDVLMTTPAIRSLKESVPGRRITLLTSRAGAAIARHVPVVDDIMVFDPPWYRHPDASGNDGILETVDTLKARRFDAAVIFTVFSQNPLPTAMLAFMAGIPRVAGYCRENPYALLTDWLPDREPLGGVRHEVQRQLDLATELGARPTSSNLVLHVPEGLEEPVHERLLAAGVDPDRKWILMHPGASEARRRYPPECFALAAAGIVERLGMQVVLTGLASERPLAATIADRAGKGVINAAGLFDLPELIVLIASAPLIVSNNTGPVHIAAAVQTPAVVLYALTNPQHAPWNVPHRILPFNVPAENRSRNVMVRYASERYFTDAAGTVAPSDVVDAASELLDAGIRGAMDSGAAVPLERVPRGDDRLSMPVDPAG